MLAEAVREEIFRKVAGVTPAVGDWVFYDGAHWIIQQFDSVHSDRFVYVTAPQDRRTLLSLDRMVPRGKCSWEWK